MKTVIAGAALVLALAGVAAAQDQPQGEHHHEGGSRPAGQPAQAHPQAPQAPAQGQARPQGQPGQLGGYQGHGAPNSQGAPAAPFQPGRQGGPAFPGGQGGYRSGAQGAPGQGQGPTFPGGQGGYRGGAQPGAPGYRPQGQGAPNPGGQGQFGQHDERGHGYDGQRFDGGRPSYGGRPGYGGRFDERGGRPGGGFSYRGNSYQRFHAAPFRFPRGYSYRSYRLHERLPLLFLAPSFFLNDYNSYYLAPPPSPEFRWVRYGPDALLVDVYSGEVVDAAYGVFDDGSGYYEDDGYQNYTQPNPY